MSAPTAVFTALSSSNPTMSAVTKPKTVPKAGPKVIPPYCSARTVNMSSQRSSSSCFTSGAGDTTGLASGANDTIAQPNSAVPTTTSSATIRMALRAVLPTMGLSRDAPGSSFMTPVRFAMASTPLSARITPTNDDQFLAKLLWDGSR